MAKYTQKQFDSELCKMLQEARSQGKRFCRIVSKVLHDRVVAKEEKNNRMPTACDAMWALWREQGCHKDRIIRTTRTAKSSTVEIEFSTDIKG